MNYVSLSKTISYILRHAPWEYELELDEEGWVSIEQLLYALRENKKWKLVKESDIEEIIKTADKKRFEIVGGRIRALYGHSICNKIVKEVGEPPEILYHGTARRFIESIEKNGLIPKGRQYVHLSVDIETAIQVGKRHDDTPVILEISAKRAWDNGVKFYVGNEKVWLADNVEWKYISVK